MILNAHPAWSYRDLAATPMTVLMAMVAIREDAARRRGKES